MQKELESFFANPDCDGYQLARQAVIGDSTFHVDYADVLRLNSLIRAGRMSEAQVEFDLLLPAWALSPRLHGLGVTLAEYFHEQEDAALFSFMRDACLEGLCQTGQGTTNRPFCVLYPTDPLDILDALGERPLRQSVQRQAAILDVFECQSGKQMCFSADLQAATAGLSPVRRDAAPAGARLT
jgi:hypothetical protein